MLTLITARTLTSFPSALIIAHTQTLQQQMLSVLQQQALASIPGVTIGAPAAPAAAAPAAAAVTGPPPIGTITPSGQLIPNAATRKGREVYVGNLAVGVMTSDLIRELFNSVLANFVPDPITNPPVCEVKLDSTGELILSRGLVKVWKRGCGRQRGWEGGG